MSDDLPVLEEDTIDALTELVNIGVGRAAASLSDLIGERIELTVPRVRFCRENEPIIQEASGGALSTTVVTQDFCGRINGRAALMFPQSSALILGGLLSGGEALATEVDAELSGILLEVGNIVLNGVLGSLSNVAGDVFDYSLPTLFDDQPALSWLLLSNDTDAELLIANVEFHVQHSEIRGTIAIVFAGGCVQTLIEQVFQTAS